MTTSQTLNRALRRPVPRVVPRVLFGLAIAFLLYTLVSGFELRPANLNHFKSLLLEARSDLPVGSSREKVKAWLDARELQYVTVYDKGGDKFLRYIVRINQGSEVIRTAEYWMLFEFQGESVLKSISSGES